MAVSEVEVTSDNAKLKQRALVQSRANFGQVKAKKSMVVSEFEKPSDKEIHYEVLLGKSIMKYC
jgi:hypothetical protein